jgi:hypothetical protein
LLEVDASSGEAHRSRLTQRHLNGGNGSSSLLWRDIAPL